MRKTIKEISELTGVSAYNLRFYEKKGLLHPKRIGKNRYREYGEEDVKRVYQIKFFRELGVPIRLIGQALDHPDYDAEEICEKAILEASRQIEKKKRIMELAEQAKVYGAQKFVDELETFYEKQRKGEKEK